MKAKRLQLLSFRTPAMRAFHVTWLAFFGLLFRFERSEEPSSPSECLATQTAEGAVPAE